MAKIIKKCVFIVFLLISDDVCGLPHNIRLRENLVEDASDPIKDKAIPVEDHSQEMVSETSGQKHDPQDSIQNTPIQPNEPVSASDGIRHESTQEGDDASLRGGLLPSKTTPSKPATTPVGGGLPTLPSLPPLPPLPPFPSPSGGSAMGPMAVLGGFSALIMPLSGVGNMFSGLPSLLSQLSSLPSLNSLPTVGG